MVNELRYINTGCTPDVHAEVFKQLTDSLKTSQVTEVDFASCGIGAVALGHLSDWVRDATAGIAHVNISDATIGEAGPALVEAVKSSSSIESITIGKGLKLPLKEKYDSETLSAWKKGIDAGGAALIAWWISTSAAAAVKSVGLSSELLTRRVLHFDPSQFDFID